MKNTLLPFKFRLSFIRSTLTNCYQTYAQTPTFAKTGHPFNYTFTSGGHGNSKHTPHLYLPTELSTPSASITNTLFFISNKSKNSEYFMPTIVHEPFSAALLNMHYLIPPDGDKP